MSHADDIFFASKAGCSIAIDLSNGTSVRTQIMDTPGDALFELEADIDCHVRQGDASVTASVNDRPVKAGQKVPVRVNDIDSNYFAVWAPNGLGSVARLCCVSSADQDQCFGYGAWLAGGGGGGSTPAGEATLYVSE